MVSRAKRPRLSETFQYVAGPTDKLTDGVWNDFTRLMIVPTFTDLAWAPVNERYDHAVLPRDAPVPVTGDETCGETYDMVTFDEFTPGDHIVHRKPGDNCFKKGTIDTIVQNGGKDPMTRESLQPWF